MTPAPKTAYSEIVDEMFSNTWKTKQEFKIHSWKLRAEKLKNVSVFEYKLLTSILAAYENKNEEGIRIAKAALQLTEDSSMQASAYRCIGNMLFHLGRYESALDTYWNAYCISKNVFYFDICLSLAGNFILYDKRLEDMKSFDQDKRIKFQDKLSSIASELDMMTSSNIDLELYRTVLQTAYSIFFSHCSGMITRFSDTSDSNVTTILFNENLTLSAVEVLNDDMNKALVDLLDKYDYEELLKYPIIFTSESYSKVEN